MTPRLQARIVKMFMWQFVPGYNYYLWLDASHRLKKGGLEGFFKHLDEADIVVLEHPDRATVRQEADYLKYRLGINCPYITPRYGNELIDEQLAAVSPEARLFASTAFLYKDSPRLRQAMKEWWYHTSRYHSIDQLSFPAILKNLSVNVISREARKDYLEYVR